MKLPSPVTRCAGFTIVEMMVTVAILAILVSIALPSFRNFIEDQRVKSVASELHASIILARSEALKRNVSITLAPRDGGWAAGWRTAHPSADGVFLDDRGAVAGVAIDGPGSVVFNGSGRLQGGASASFTITGDATSRTKCLSIDLSGRPTVKSCS